MKLSKLNIAKFVTYVREAGAEILPSTNEYELLRFKSKEGIGLVYKNSKGIFNLQGSACTAYDFFFRGRAWKASKNYLDWERPKLLEHLVERDGDRCFLCGKEMHGDMTVEHLLAIAHGGNSQLANLCLVHNECNSRAGSLPLTEKIQMFFERKNTNE